MATTLSTWGSQKMRYTRSMASSLPFPKKIWLGCTPLWTATFASFWFSNIWWNSCHLSSPTAPSVGWSPSQQKLCFMAASGMLFFFFKPLTVSAFYSSSAASWIPLLFCVSWTVMLSFSYSGSSSRKDRWIHAIQKLFKPTQCWAQNGVLKPVTEFQLQSKWLIV